MTHPALAAADLAVRLREPDAPLVIDVRSAAEFAAAHLRGSYNVPLPLLAEHAQEFAQRMGAVDGAAGLAHGGVVLVCQSGRRAGQAHGVLDAVGLQDAAVLDGGIAAALGSGLDVVRGSGPWAMDRQVRMAAGTLVLTGLAVGRLVSPRGRLLSAAIGTGLTWSALSNTCGFAAILSRMPWNRSVPEPTRDSVVRSLPVPRTGR